MVVIRSLTTIFTYLIGLCGVIPLLPWLATFPRLFLVVGIIVGFWQDRRGSWHLKPWVQNVAITPVFLYYALQFSRSNPVQPVISVLAIMLAVRLSGEKTVRYSLQTYAISIFCLASSSLFDLSPVFLIYLGLLLLMIALALVLLTFQNQDQDMTVSLSDLKKILFSAMLMPLLAVPLLLFFFPIMPRTQQPLWQFLNQPTSRTTGYSDIVEPGSQSSITESVTLAFRAEMPRQTQSQLYWRGTVFNRTDGVKWTRTEPIPAEQPKSAGKKVTQVIYPEPSAVRTLIALDRPIDIAIRRVKHTPDGVFELIGTAKGRLSYSADSEPSGLIAQLNSVSRPFYLQLPDQLPVRIKALASEIVLAGEKDRAKVQFLENYFRNEGYRYSTTDLATGDTAVEQFLFDRKKGHCEFFASSFALLLRAAGVPSRLVGGYLGGEYNPLGGYYLVSDARAHVWVEAYIVGSGWVRIDPSSLATNAGDVWKAPGSGNLRLRISMAFDSFNHLWNRSVISYDLEQQIKAATILGARLQGFSVLKILFNSLPYFAGGLLLVSIFFVFRQSSLFRSREQRILQRFLRILEQKFNISAVDSGEGLFEIASLTGNSHVSDFTFIYARAIYRDRRLTDDEYLSLQRILLAMKSNESKIS